MMHSSCRAACLALAITAGAAPVAGQQRPAAPWSASLIRPPGAPEQRVAILQGLDKVTARPQRIIAPLGKSVQFGTLSITVSECLVNAPDAAPESAAHLAITDIKPGNPPTRLFAGWMFVSAPALSGLDHSVYDVTVLACTTAAQATAPSSSR